MATVTARGQVTLRKDLLQHLGVQPGEEIEFSKMPDGTLQVSARPKGSIEDFFGILKGKSKKVLTIEEMNQVISDAWAGKR